MDVNKLGMGVLIQMLGGNEKTVNAVQGSLGKEIANLSVYDEALTIRFKDGGTLRLWDGGQSCCESRYMNTDDDLSYYEGATLLDMELKDGPCETSEWGGEKESQFLVVRTSKGEFTVVNYNEHNGYYGGFWIQAEYREG